MPSMRGKIQKLLFERRNKIWMNWVVPLLLTCLLHSVKIWIPFFACLPQTFIYKAIGFFQQMYQIEIRYFLDVKLTKKYLAIGTGSPLRYKWGTSALLRTYLVIVRLLLSNVHLNENVIQRMVRKASIKCINYDQWLVFLLTNKQQNVDETRNWHTRI